MVIGGYLWIFKDVFSCVLPVEFYDKNLLLTKYVISSLVWYSRFLSKPPCGRQLKHEGVGVDFSFVDIYNDVFLHCITNIRLSITLPTFVQWREMWHRFPKLIGTRVRPTRVVDHIPPYVLCCRHVWLLRGCCSPALDRSYTNNKSEKGKEQGVLTVFGGRMASNKLQWYEKWCSTKNYEVMDWRP